MKNIVQNQYCRLFLGSPLLIHIFFPTREGGCWLGWQFFRIKTIMFKTTLVLIRTLLKERFLLILHCTSLINFGFEGQYLLISLLFIVLSFPHFFSNVFLLLLTYTLYTHQIFPSQILLDSLPKTVLLQYILI